MKLDRLGDKVTYIIIAEQRESITQLENKLRDVVAHLKNI